MKTLTASVTAFAFDELSADAKNRALDNKRTALYEIGCLSGDMDWGVRYALLCELSPDGPNEDGTPETWVRLMGECEVLWSLSHCQGDGVALSGTLYRDAAPLLPWPAVRDARGSFARAVGARLRHSGHYCHEYSFAVDLLDADGDEHEAPEAFVDELRRICRVAARSGYRAQEHATSDETLSESLREDGVVFDEHGGVLPWEFLQGVTQ